jgi:hypothetical protein
MHDEACQRYALAALKNESHKVASAQEGSRNSTLNNAALALGHLVGAGVLSEKEVWEALLAACGQNGLAKEDRKGVQATIRSGLTAGISTTSENRTSGTPKGLSWSIFQQWLEATKGKSRALLMAQGTAPGRERRRSHFSGDWK